MSSRPPVSADRSLFSWYALFKAVGWAISKLVARVRIQGLEHIPEEGPYLVVSSHQSFLDPIFIQAHMPRAPHTLTKSTQFAGRPWRWILPRLQTLPTRRYRVDPQVVRAVLRKLDQGEGVFIYAEGERTWDGAVQPLRRGTVRLILKAGVPVIPCGAAGSYDVLPRWSRTIRRQDVWLRFGEPLEFGAHHDREERDCRVDEVHDHLVAELERLAAVPGTPWEELGAADPAREES